MAPEFIHRRKFARHRIAICAHRRIREVVAMGAKDVLGKEGEQAAVGYLEKCGFRILDRNWRCADGEIDIVAVERHTLVVCEVKTRSGMRYGGPLAGGGRAELGPP